MKGIEMTEAEYLKELQDRVIFLKELIELYSKHKLFVSDQDSSYPVIIEINENNTLEDLEDLLADYELAVSRAVKTRPSRQF